MSSPSPLQVIADAERSQIAALVLEVAARERDLNALKLDLRELQHRYLADIGPLYAELIPLDAAVAEAEIKAGLRLPPEEDLDADVGTSTVERHGCGAGSEPSDDLKRMFRDVARAVHPDMSPDLNLDERTRYRRHSLMAEANRAYAERDEDRLRLILRAWHLDPDAGVISDDPDAERARLRRRASALAERLVEIEAELTDLRTSAIARLKAKIDEARRQGWDLFAEMMRQVRREIAMAHAKLAKMKHRDQV